jgi:hypothetical protein
MPWWDFVHHPSFLIAILVVLLLLLVLGAIFFSVGISVANGKHRDFGDVFVTNLIGVIFALFLPFLIGWILYLYIINVRHETGWGGAILAWLIAWIIPVVIVSVIFVAIVLIPGFAPLWPF